MEMKKMFYALRYIPSSQLLYLFAVNSYTCKRPGCKWINKMNYFTPALLLSLSMFIYQHILKAFSKERLNNVASSLLFFF